jgi:hypothetical protein
MSSDYDVTKDRRPLTLAVWDKLADKIIGTIKAVKVQAHERIGLLEARVGELEAQPRVQYHGVWIPDSEYAAGALVTQAGSIWHSNRLTRDRPGTSDAWTLAVKKGRDGR